VINTRNGRVSIMFAERSEGTASGARRELDVRRARSMGDSNERGDTRP